MIETAANVSPSELDEIARICAQAIGPAAEPEHVERLVHSSSNRVYRLWFANRDSLVLRIAPAEAARFASERHLMRNEYAAAPWFTSLGSLVPKIIACDWTHTVVEADWMLQSVAAGEAAAGPLGLVHFPRQTWHGYYRQLGRISRQIHSISGTSFGSHVGETFTRFEEYLGDKLEAYATDLARAGVSTASVGVAQRWLAQNAGVFDSVEKPSLLSGDLWIVNTLVQDEDGRPVITGVLDFDRSCWGDPAFDWTIWMARAKQDERTAFWEEDGYGALPDPDGSLVHRLGLYAFLHTSSIVIEHVRLGTSDTTAAADRLHDVVDQLTPRAQALASRVRQRSVPNR